MQYMCLFRITYVINNVVSRGNVGYVEYLTSVKQILILCTFCQVGAAIGQLLLATTILYGNQREAPVNYGNARTVFVVNEHLAISFL